MYTKYIYTYATHTIIRLERYGHNFQLSILLQLVLDPTSDRYNKTIPTLLLPRACLPEWPQQVRLPLLELGGARLLDGLPQLQEVAQVPLHIRLQSRTKDAGFPRLYLHGRGEAEKLAFTSTNLEQGMTQQPYVLSLSNLTTGKKSGSKLVSSSPGKAALPAC